MAYSSINADSNADDDETFDDKGAIMEALGESAPSLKKGNTKQKAVKQGSKKSLTS